MKSTAMIDQDRDERNDDYNERGDGSDCYPVDCAAKIELGAEGEPEQAADEERRAMGSGYAFAHINDALLLSHRRPTEHGSQVSPAREPPSIAPRPPAGKETGG